MSIYDRDYFRDRWDGRGWGATKVLIGLNILVFILDRGGGTFFDPFVLYSDVFTTGNYWQLLTSAFLHGGVWHLFCNMLVLWWAGQEIESIYGPKRFLRFYLLGVLTASLAHVAWAHWRQIPSSAIGASGGVMAVMMLFTFHYPRHRVLVFGIVPMEMRWMMGIYILMDLSGTFDNGSPVANAAHLGGAAFGAAYALWESRRT